MNTKIRWFILFIIIIIGGGYFIFNQQADDSQATLTVKSGDFIKEISISGKVTAANKVILTFRFIP